MAVRVTDADTDTGFVHLCLRAAAAHFQNVMVGSAIPGISREDVLDFKFCLPPLAEQRRIVAKVEELMGLCDALEAAQREWEAVRTRLRTSALHQLTEPGSDSNPPPSSSRISWPYHEPEDLALLRHRFSNSQSPADCWPV